MDGGMLGGTELDRLRFWTGNHAWEKLRQGLASVKAEIGGGEALAGRF